MLHPTEVPLTIQLHYCTVHHIITSSYKKRASSFSFFGISASNLVLGDCVCVKAHSLALLLPSQTLVEADFFQAALLSTQGRRTQTLLVATQYREFGTPEFHMLFFSTTQLKNMYSLVTFLVYLFRAYWFFQLYTLRFCNRFSHWRKHCTLHLSLVKVLNCTKTCVWFVSCRSLYIGV